jgi:cytochrome c-type biogenesis protein CcmH/NrfG
MIISRLYPPQLMELTMKNVTALVLATSLASTAAYAGGPVVVAVEGEPEVMTVAPTSSINAGIVVPLLLLVVLAAALATQ